MPSDIQIIVRVPGQPDIDITYEVSTVYELLLHSMDYGSGFLSIEDVTTMTRLSVAAGYEIPAQAEGQMSAYLRMYAPFCPTCKKAVQRWNNQEITPTSRIISASLCEHRFELSTVPGEPAGLRPVN
jgi:hypothetical protein